MLFFFLCLLASILACEKEPDILWVAPDFTLQNLQGNPVSLSQFRGKVVLIDFWATWCSPCRAAIPELVRLREKYKDRGLVILGISVDDPHRMKDVELIAFRKQHKIDYSVLRSNAEVTRKYFGTSRMAIPTLFFIDRNGVIVDKHVGFSPKAADKVLKGLLL
jgi:peroxiredoxin